jgi:hypothetical protein
MSIDDVKNKSICVYPFTHSYIGSQYERKLCCVSDDIVELKKTNLKDFWNSDTMKDVRLKMLSGEKVKYCNRCYEFEELGVSSLRQECNRDYNSLEELTNNLNSDGSLNTPPNFFDHRTIHCNLQCLSCGYTYSSTHMKLSEDMYNYRPDFEVDFNYEKEMSDDIISSIKLKKCKSIYWAGGEPMMSHIHWDVMDTIFELYNDENYAEYVKNLKIWYNTNLTRLMWKNKHIPEQLYPIQPSIQASIDGTNETFEYCRDGANWDVVSNNWKEYYQYLNKNKQMGVASVLSSPVIMDIDRWFEFFEPYDPILYNHKFIINLENTPSNFLDIRFFPEYIFEPVIDNAIRKFENSKLRGKEKTIDILLSYKKEKYESPHIFENEQTHKAIKSNTVYRDKFLRGKKTYEQLLYTINQSAFEWFIKL